MRRMRMVIIYINVLMIERVPKNMGASGVRFQIRPFRSVTGIPVSVRRARDGDVAGDQHANLHLALRRARDGEVAMQ